MTSGGFKRQREREQVRGEEKEERWRGEERRGEEEREGREKIASGETEKKKNQSKNCP